MQSDCPSLHADIDDYKEDLSRYVKKYTAVKTAKRDLGTKPFVWMNPIEPSLQNPTFGIKRKFAFTNKRKLCNPRCEDFFLKPFCMFGASLVTQKQCERGTAGSALRPHGLSWREGQHPRYQQSWPSFDGLLMARCYSSEL